MRIAILLIFVLLPGCLLTQEYVEGLHSLAKDVHAPNPDEKPSLDTTAFAPLWVHPLLVVGVPITLVLDFFLAPYYCIKIVSSLGDSASVIEDERYFEQNIPSKKNSSSYTRKRNLIYLLKEGHDNPH